MSMSKVISKGGSRLILTCSLSLFFILAIASTATAATVSVSPFNQNVAVEGVFTVNVNIDSGSDNLQAAHVELNYDTNALTATGYTKGTLLGTDILEEPGIGISTGKVTYGAARTSSNPVSPVSGMFFSVQFKVNRSAPAGISVLTLVNMNLKSDSATNIPGLQINSGQVNVMKTGTNQVVSTQTPVSAGTSAPNSKATGQATVTRTAQQATSQATATATQTAANNQTRRPAAPGFDGIVSIAILAVSGSIISRLRRGI